MRSVLLLTAVIELHAHTTFSDGTLTPTDLVAAARVAGVRALAISDHDTVSGWDEAIAAATDTNLEIVPAIELSTVHNGRGMHILGFWPDPQRLQQPLSQRQLGRRQRGEAMATKLAELGYPIALPVLPNGAVPGRPHLAYALVAAGHARSYDDAFHRFLRDGGPAYVDYGKFTAVEGIRLLRDCGAIPVWAHAYLFRGGQPEAVLPELLEAGLMGLEVIHPSHSASDVRKLERLCDRHQLLPTGGSDYHGPHPDGKGHHASRLNGLGVPYEWLDWLKEARDELRAA